MCHKMSSYSLTIIHTYRVSPKINRHTSQIICKKDSLMKEEDLILIKMEQQLIFIVIYLLCSLDITLFFLLVGVIEDTFKTKFMS